MPTILVVDDCSIDRRLIGGLLCCVADWQIDFACDGGEAWGKIEQSPPDVVVTDLQMPEVDGLELVRRVKQRFPQLPVILVTAQGSEALALTALRSGAAHFAAKRWLARELVPTVQNVLAIAQALRRGSCESHCAAERAKPLPAVGPTCGAAEAAWQVDFELENDDRLIGRLIEYLQHHLPDWAEAESMQIALALHEAITNAMHHGNLEVSSELRDACESRYVHLIGERKCQAPFADRRVRISAQFRPDALQFDVVDQGHGFDPQSIADPTSLENLQKLSGRGLLLIRTFMDVVSHNPVGNRITMVKRNKRIEPGPL